jgi:hypothetical protein
MFFENNIKNQNALLFLIKRRKKITALVRGITKINTGVLVVSSD